MNEQPPSVGPDLSGLRIEERVRPVGAGRRAKRLIAGSTVIVILLIGAYLALKSRAAVVTVAVARPAGDPASTALLNASGYITPRRRATVAAKITARVVDVYVDEGMIVKEGQLLARLDDADAVRRLQAARTQRDATAALIASLKVNLANAERELGRNEGLAADGFASAQALDQARTIAESLRAQVAAAQEQVRAADGADHLLRRNLGPRHARLPLDLLRRRRVHRAAHARHHRHQRARLQAQRRRQLVARALIRPGIEFSLTFVQQIVDRNGVGGLLERAAIDQFRQRILGRRVRRERAERQPQQRSHRERRCA